MKSKITSEQQVWQKVLDRLPDDSLVLGGHWSHNLWQDPKRLAFVLSRYKFAAKMACKSKKVLELGCSEGIGTPILAEFAWEYLGVDLDAEAITTAQRNWGSEKCRFAAGDFLGQTFGRFDTIVSLDVIEHIYPEFEDQFFETVFNNLGPNGLCVIGTPNITSVPYASPASQAGHVNMYDASRLQAAMQTVFHNVLMFGINDEIVHTGYAPMAHYLVAVGCYKRNRREKP